MGIRSFLDSNGVEHSVCGQTLRFYPMRLSTSFMLRTVGKPLAKAFSTLFADTSRDAGVISKDIIAADHSGREEIGQPISVEMARLRHEQRTQAIEDIIHQFTSPTNSTLVGKLIMDSLRDDFSWKGNGEDKIIIDDKSANEFMDSVDISSFKDFVVGLAKANKEVFGKVGEKMALAVEGLADRINENKFDQHREEPPTAG